MDGDNKEDLTDSEIEKIIQLRKRVNDIIISPVEKVHEGLLTEQIIRLLRYKKFDVDAAFGVLKSGLQLRLIDELAKVPYEEYKRVYPAQIFLALKQRAADGSKIIWIRIKNWDVNEIDLLTFLAAVYHYLDETLFSTKSQINGLSCIIDVSEVGIIAFARILSLFKIGVVSEIAKFAQGGYPIKIKAVHYVNAPWIITAFYAGIQYLLSKKMRQRLHFHPKGTEVLLKYFDKEVLPVALSGSIPDDNAQDVKLLESINKKGVNDESTISNYRKYFLVPK